MAGKSKKTQVEIIGKMAAKIFKLLELEVELTVEEKEDVTMIDLKTENPAVLIGRYGEALTAFQLILSMMVYQKLGEWVRLSVDVDGYRQRRFEALQQMALSAAQKVRFSKRPYNLPAMNAGERRIVHMALSGNDDIQTQSEGEEPERYVVIESK